MTKIATSFEIAPSLYLVRQAAASQGTTAAPQPTNHVAVIDCSGSMTSDLPKIREQLKRRLPKLLADGDTFSLIWFSGRGQFGALLEAEPVATLKDLQDVNKAIDRWLRPIGLTGFKEPLDEAANLVTRVAKKNKNPFALFFMSDGCDNQWSRVEIIKTVEALGSRLASATFVEYGYYADRQLLSSMAEKCGGSLIFAESFDDYEPKFEAKMQQRAVGEKKIEVTLSGDPIGGFAFALDADKHEITTYEATGKITIPSNTTEIWYLSPSAVGQHAGAPVTAIGLPREVTDNGGAAGAWAAVSLFAVRMKPDIVYPLLKVLGDVAFIELFAGCFGKQKYTEFMQAARTAAFYTDVRYTKGYDPKKVPADDAFTVLDLLHALSADDDARILMDHNDFKYTKISRSRVDADENFYVAEQEKLDTLRAELALAKKPADVKRLNAEIAELTLKKRDALKFVADAQPNGYEIANLTYNENRANISLLVKKTGTVDLTDRLFEAGTIDVTKVPAAFKTNIWRNYALVVDGLVNVEKLPVTIHKSTYAMLAQAGVSMREVGDSSLPTRTVVIDVKPLPIINRNMVGACSAAELIEDQYELTQAKAVQKVYNHYAKTLAPGAKLASFAEQYGEEAANWLKEQGITPGGFSPKTTQGETRDFYLGKELEVKLKGMSSLPKLEDAKAGKGGVCGAFMKETIEDVERNIKAFGADGAAKTIEKQQKHIVGLTRKLMQKMAQKKFAIIVGQVWPKEFKSIDENTLKVKIDDKEITGTIEMSEVKVEI